jgi:hypothetical protein
MEIDLSATSKWFDWERRSRGSQKVCLLVKQFSRQIQVHSTRTHIPLYFAHVNFLSAFQDLFQGEKTKKKVGKDKRMRNLCLRAKIKYELSIRCKLSNDRSALILVFDLWRFKC